MKGGSWLAGLLGRKRCDPTRDPMPWVQRAEGELPCPETAPVLLSAWSPVSVTIRVMGRCLLLNFWESVLLLR